MRSPLSQVRDEALLTLGFGAQFQNTLLPEQVHRELRSDSVGKLYSRDSVGFVDIARIIVKNQCVASFLKLDQLVRNTRIHWCRTVFEKIHEAEKIRVGKAFDNLLEYLLRAARCDQPVVHDRNSHDLPILVNASWA